MISQELSGATGGKESRVEYIWVTAVMCSVQRAWDTWVWEQEVVSHGEKAVTSTAGSVEWSMRPEGWGDGAGMYWLTRNKADHQSRDWSSGTILPSGLIIRFDSESGSGPRFDSGIPPRTSFFEVAAFCGVGVRCDRIATSFGRGESASPAASPSPESLQSARGRAVEDAGVGRPCVKGEHIFRNRDPRVS